MSGFAVLVRKELLESWRTRRLPVVSALFLLLGMLSPISARYLPEILRLALGDQLTVPIPDPTTAMAIDQLQKNLAQLGALTAIALAMGSVAGELDRGTAAFVLAQPVTRRAFLAAKLVALAIVLAVAAVLSVAVAWIYTAILFEPLPVAGWVALALLGWLALAVWAGLTFVASAATGSVAGAAGLGFVALISLSAAAAIPAADRVLPSGLAQPAAMLALGRWDTVDVGLLATAVLGSGVILAGSLVASLVVFRRREL